MKKLSFLILSCVLLISCSSDFEEKGISEFIIDNNALKDGELIEVIYNGGSPDYNNSLEYYIKMIVVSVETKDTFNLLTTSVFDISRTDNIRNFISFDSDTYKMMQHIQLKQEFKNVNDIKPKQISKVLINKEFKEVEENNYPTVIGMLGEVTDAK